MSKINRLDQENLIKGSFFSIIMLQFFEFLESTHSFQNFYLEKLILLETKVITTKHQLISQQRKLN